MMETTTRMTPEQVLDAAADYIHEHGWCRGKVQDSEGRVCLEGAVRRGLEGPPLLESWAQLAAWKALAESLTFSPTSWNDDFCKDADEAIHALKKAKEFL